MQTKKGFTLIELLVVVAIIGLLATLGVIAFRDAQRKARDSKRVADISAVVKAFTMANQEGKVLCQAGAAAADCGAAIGAALSKVSSARICNACSTAGANVTTDYINLASLKDPLYTGATICNGTLTASCDYGLSASATIESFQLFFFTERDDIAGLAAQKNHTANQVGVVQ